METPLFAGSEVSTPGAPSSAPAVSSPPPAAALDEETPVASARCLPVALRGKMTADGYRPENWAWVDHLTKPDDETGRVYSDGTPRRIGRDPMSIPLEVLTGSGHGPRGTRRIVSALGDEVVAIDCHRHKDLRQHCLLCAENAAEVRRCANINCPFWPYRMGRNPHNPKRGHNPFERGPAAPDRLLAREEVLE